jgi:hypothetical protein
MFTDIPLVCAQALEKTWDLAMWSLRSVGGASGRNPATSPAFLARGAAGEELGVARARFACLAETRSVTP